MKKLISLLRRFGELVRELFIFLNPNDMKPNITVTQAVLDANPNMDVEVNDTVIRTEVTAPVTQAMLDADPELVAEGFKVGDLINEPSPKTFSASFTGSVDATGAFTAAVTGDLTGNATGTINPDGTFNGSFDGTVV